MLRWLPEIEIRMSRKGRELSEIEWVNLMAGWKLEAKVMKASSSDSGREHRAIYRWSAHAYAGFRASSVRSCRHAVES